MNFPGASKMVQRAKAPATRLTEVALVLRVHVRMKGGNQPHKTVF